jgi:hypothetical protein
MEPWFEPIISYIMSLSITTNRFGGCHIGTGTYFCCAGIPFSACLDTSLSLPFYVSHVPTTTSVARTTETRKYSHSQLEHRRRGLAHKEPSGWTSVAVWEWRACRKNWWIELRFYYMWLWKVYVGEHSWGVMRSTAVETWNCGTWYKRKTPEPWQQVSAQIDWCHVSSVSSKTRWTTRKNDQKADYAKEKTQIFCALTKDWWIRSLVVTRALWQ